ncbi:vascular endothelial growth factor receptor 2-like [Ptychodera flava]|uniref:vascular endothelial growth factor receptor 2-like n=1 Tax=Ptychodera flava TaxID=63121 RepID=UPI003969C9FB
MTSITRISYVFLITVHAVFSGSSTYKWLVEPTDTTVTEGKSTTLNCAVDTSGDSRILPEWYKVVTGKDEKLITDTGVSYDRCCDVMGDVKNGEVNLMIRSAKREDEGTWICRFARIINDQTKRATLSVVAAENHHNRQQLPMLAVTCAVATFTSILFIVLWCKKNWRQKKVELS